jgi:dipeptidyl aminopeptidase/acylaminoacyl peptidase
VNYRGSTGYGKDFVSAGDREWGGQMLGDIIDAVRHLVDAGLADPSRLAIYGASYGGYTALCAAAFEPAVFSCAACFAAPTDLRSFISSVPGTWNPTIAELHRRVGHPVRDAEFLWSRSPLSRVADIRIPLLIGHGARDPRVPQSEAEQLVAALRTRGVPHEYLLFPDEGHSLVKAANRMVFRAAMEQFLARMLGGRFEPAESIEPPAAPRVPG